MAHLSSPEARPTHALRSSLAQDEVFPRQRWLRLQWLGFSSHSRVRSSRRGSQVLVTLQLGRLMGLSYILRKGAIILPLCRRCCGSEGPVTSLPKLCPLSCPLPHHSCSRSAPHTCSSASQVLSSSHLGPRLPFLHCHSACFKCLRMTNVTGMSSGPGLWPTTHYMPWQSNF